MGLKDKGGSLGDRLRLARTLGGISARELDRLAGITTGHTSNIEAGRRNHIEVRIATRLAGVLGVSLDWLLQGLGLRPSAVAILAAIEGARAERERAGDRDTGS